MSPTSPRTLFVWMDAEPATGARITTPTVEDVRAHLDTHPDQELAVLATSLYVQILIGAFASLVFLHVVGLLWLLFGGAR